MSQVENKLGILSGYRFHWEDTHIEQIICVGFYFSPSTGFEMGMIFFF